MQVKAIIGEKLKSSKATSSALGKQKMVPRKPGEAPRKSELHHVLRLEERRSIVHLHDVPVCFDHPFPPSYLQYLELCSRVVRHSLKEEFRAAAIKRGEQGLKYGTWSEGKQTGTSKHLQCLHWLMFFRDHQEPGSQALVAL